MFKHIVEKTLSFPFMNCNSELSCFSFKTFAGESFTQMTSIALAKELNPNLIYIIIYSLYAEYVKQTI